MSGTAAGAAAPRFQSNAGVSVAVRVRPRLDHETRGIQGQIVCLPVNSQAVQLGTDSLWGYDVALGENDRNGSLWERCQISSLIEGAFNGFNASIIAYGQTGSGKTYTMGMTAETGGSTDAAKAHSKTAGPAKGIAAGVCEEIAQTLEAVKAAVASGVAGPHGLTSLEASVSCLQVYCEQLQDVLHPETPSGSIAVRTTRSGATIVTGAQPEPVQCLEDMHRWLAVGIAARTSGGTAMSEASSRSHLVFSIALRGTQLLQDGSSRRMNSIVRLVDLAGSERQKKTQASGTRFAESVHINGGLLALGNVINALASASTAPQGKAPHTHIPYRDSKLTRLLVDCLGGNGRTLFIACVSPTASNQHETLSTLRYAQRVLAIKNHPAAQVELVPLPEHSPLQARKNTDDAAQKAERGARGSSAAAASRRRSASARVRQRGAQGSARTGQRGGLALAVGDAESAVARTATWLLSLPGWQPATVLAALQQEAGRVRRMLPGAGVVGPSLPAAVESGTPSAPHLIISAGGTPAPGSVSGGDGDGSDASLLSPVVMPPTLPGGSDSAVSSSATAAASGPLHESLGGGELGSLRRTLALQAGQMEAANKAHREHMDRAAAEVSQLQSEVSLLRSALAAAEASHLSGLAVSRHDVSPAKPPPPAVRASPAQPPTPSDVGAHAGSASVTLDSPQQHGAGAGGDSVFDSALERSIRDAVTPQLCRAAPPALSAERKAALQGTVRRLRAEVSRAVVSASRARSLEDSNHSWASVTALEAELARARKQLLEEDAASASGADAVHVAATDRDLDVSQIAETPQRSQQASEHDTRNSVSHGIAAAVAAAAEAVARELETPAAAKGVKGGSKPSHPPATIGRLRGAVAAAARSMGLQADSPAVGALEHLCSAAADAVVRSSRGTSNASPGAEASASEFAPGGVVGSKTHLSPEQWLAKERRWNKKQEQLQQQLDATQAQLAAATAKATPYRVNGSMSGSSSALGMAASPMGPVGGAVPGSAGETPATSSQQAPSHASVPEHTGGASMSNTATRLDFAGAFDSQSDGSDDGGLLVASDDEEEGGALHERKGGSTKRISEAYTSAPSAPWGRGRMLSGSAATGLQLLRSLDEAELNLALRGSESPEADGEALHTSGMVWSLGN